MTLRDLVRRVPKESLLRLPLARRLWRKYPKMGSVHARTRFDIWDRPAYAYGVYSAASLAKRLGIPRITAVEFGVARGAGLLALERISAEIGAALDVGISVVGFDSGQGNPPPVDYRDLPHIWGEGFYAMDEAALRAQLTTARLILGDVRDTVRTFWTSARDPIGFISFDLDYYSSTVSAFEIFDGAPATRLPRVYCYFDDIVWPENACHNEFTGEYLAIREFNDAHPTRKIAKLPHLGSMRPIREPWNEQIYVYHDFEHPEYCTNIRKNAPLGANEMPLYLREQPLPQSQPVAAST